MFKHQDLQMFGHPLEVVGRGSETQLQVGENCITLPRLWVVASILDIFHYFKVDSSASNVTVSFKRMKNTHK